MINKLKKKKNYYKLLFSCKNGGNYNTSLKIHGYYHRSGYQAY